MKKNINIFDTLRHGVRIGILVFGLTVLIGCGSGGSGTSSKIVTVTRLGKADVDVNLINRSDKAIEFCLAQDGTQFQYSLGIVNAYASTRKTITLDAGKLHRLTYALAGSDTEACYGVTYGRFTAQDKQSYTYEFHFKSGDSSQWNGSWQSNWVFEKK